MKLDIFDSYNIRARFSPSIILFGPIALTFFFCFQEIYTVASSTVMICILLALTNYVPIVQRAIHKRQDIEKINYASKFLEMDDQTIDFVTKNRYYRKLASIDKSFSAFNNPSTTDEFRSCCESAVIYLRNCTRDNHLVQEENINYGFYRNMLTLKLPGIIICIVMGAFTVLYSIFRFKVPVSIPLCNWAALTSNILLGLFWIIGINKKMMDQVAKRYAKTLLAAIDTLQSEKSQGKT